MKTVIWTLTALAVAAGAFIAGRITAPTTPNDGYVDLSPLPEGLREQYRDVKYLKQVVANHERFTQAVAEREAEQQAREPAALPAGVTVPDWLTLYAPKEGMRWPDVAFEGEEPGLEESKDKWTVLNLWATWCAPCVKELPDIQTANEKLEPAGIIILPVNGDVMGKDTLESVKAVYAKRRALSLMPLIATGQNVDGLLSAFGQSRMSVTLPTNIIFAPGGEPVAYFDGLPDKDVVWADDEMINFLLDLKQSTDG